MESTQVASKLEVLDALSRIVRSSDTDGKNQASICRAAELLGKYYGMFDGSEFQREGEQAVVFVDDLRG